MSLREQKAQDAGNAMRKAIRLGLLVPKEKCQKCGAKAEHGHHPNYDMPLTVIWLCKKCHVDLHKNIRFIRRLFRFWRIVQETESDAWSMKIPMVNIRTKLPLQKKWKDEIWEHCKSDSSVEDFYKKHGQPKRKLRTIVFVRQRN